MNERQIFKEPLPPNGPSPSRPAYICWNMLLRNIDSKFSDAFLALALTCSTACGLILADLPVLPVACICDCALALPALVIALSEAEKSTGFRFDITSPRYRPGSRL